MKTLAILLLAHTMGIPQSFAEQDKVSATSKKYHQSRLQDSVPPYGLAKVRDLVKSLNKTSGEDEDSGLMELPAATYAKLSKAEKFTYNMIHGESFQQNCDAFLPFEGEEKKITAHFPSPFGSGDQFWSERQVAFFRENRGTTITLLEDCIKEQGTVGANFKWAIIEINAWELIPTLQSAFLRTRRDMDILSCLNLLMKNGKYDPFMKSATHRKLYSDDADYMATIEANRANQDLILSRSKAYYQSKRRK